MGIGLNVSNEESVACFSDSSFIVKSAELPFERLENTHTFAYGLLPLMTFEHCPNATVRGVDCNTCKHKGKELSYDDGIARFPLRAVIGEKRCYYSLYADKIVDLKNKVLENRYMVLTDPEIKACKRIGERPL